MSTRNGSYALTLTKLRLSAQPRLQRSSGLIWLVQYAQSADPRARHVYAYSLHTITQQSPSLNSLNRIDHTLQSSVECW